MLALKRLLLVIFVLVAPIVMTAALNIGAKALLAATNRVIDPQILQDAAIVEFVVFFFVAILEARARWST
jgi:hypothetical protein